MALTVNEAKPKLAQVVEHFSDSLKKLRTGRANAGMIENVSVSVYGQDMKLPHVATVTVLDAQTLQIAPFDPSNIEAISAAIREDQSLGLNPADDGKVVRIPIPAMTTERRQEVVKMMREKVEEANIAMRNIRHDVINLAKQQEKDKEISRDDVKGVEKQINEMLDASRTEIEAIAKAKETEIMTV